MQYSEEFIAANVVDNINFIRIRENLPREYFTFYKDGEKCIGSVGSYETIINKLGKIWKSIVSTTEPPFIFRPRRNFESALEVTKVGKLLEAINSNYTEFNRARLTVRFPEKLEVFWQLCLKFPECWIDYHALGSRFLYQNKDAVNNFEKLVNLVRQIFNSADHKEISFESFCVTSDVSQNLTKSIQNGSLSFLMNKRVTNYNNRKNRTIRAWKRVIKDLSKTNSTMLVCSIDLFYARRFEFSTKQFIESQTLDDIRVDIKAFFNRSRRNGLFRHVLYYFLILEVSRSMGPVYRTIFLLEDCEDIELESIGNDIGEYWRASSQFNACDYIFVNGMNDYGVKFGLGRIGKSNDQDKAMWHSFVHGYIPYMVNHVRNVGLSPNFARTQGQNAAAELGGAEPMSRVGSPFRLETKVFTHGKGQAYSVSGV